jgi:tyrosyl-DNA phosphodiesterase-1
MEQMTDQNCSVNVDIYFNEIFIFSKRILVNKESTFETIEVCVKNLFKFDINTNCILIYLNDRLLTEDEKLFPFSKFLDQNVMIKFNIVNLLNIVIPEDYTETSINLLKSKRTKRLSKVDNRFLYLKNGRRIFNNKNSYCKFKEYFNDKFIDFYQLFYEDLKLNEDLKENIDEVVGVISMIASTYTYETSFIEPLILTNQIKAIIIKNKDVKSYPLIQINNKNITYIHPEMDISQDWGCFHSKMILLKFENFIRLIIPTANLSRFDWYTLGQLVWFQDFYLKKENSSDNKEGVNDFESYIHYIFNITFPKEYNKQDWYTELGIDLNKYDFSTACVDLVASFPGRFSEIEKIGLGRVKSLIKSYKCKNTYEQRVIYQCSSFGSIKDKFLMDFIETFLNKKYFAQVLKQKIDIVYPTLEYIKNIENGRSIGRCLFLKKDILNQESFPKRNMKLLQLQNGLKSYLNSDLVCHSKILVVTKDNLEIDLNSLIYIGSHNFSLSAWGAYEKNNSQIKTANYEVGLIFNPLKISIPEKQSIVDTVLVSLFQTNYYKSDDIAWTTDYHR